MLFRSRYWDATPDSDYLGATPELIEISDIESNEDYFVDGIPTLKFKNLIDDFYLTRKNKVVFPSAYSYECKECTKERILRKRKHKKPKILVQ